MDTLTVNEHDLGKALQESALLAHVKISVWDSIKADRKVMEDVKNLHHAKGDVGRVMKNMLAGVDGPLKNVRSAYTAVRMRHYELTLPWISNVDADSRKTGPRLLPHPLFVRYLQEIGELVRLAEDALNGFIPIYPDLIVKAQPFLGGMFTQSDYPSADEVRSRFRIYRDYEPIPDGTGFKGLPPQLIERLSRNLNRRQQIQKDQANKAMWEEAKTRVGHLVERLAEEDTKFKEASVRAVRELVTILPGWNIGGDTRVDEIVGDIDTMLNGIEATDLRKDPGLRKSVADDAKRISDRLKGWGI
jgi:hypothetical protein